MPLTMRPTGLGAGVNKDRPDYTIFCGGWEIGRIYETRGGPDHLHWFWSMTVNGPMTRSDKAIECRFLRSNPRPEQGAFLPGRAQSQFFRATDEDRSPLRRADLVLTG